MREMLLYLENFIQKILMKRFFIKTSENNKPNERKFTVNKIEKNFQKGVDKVK